ncbi:MAG: hypothetical protein UW24_C0017G0009 [Parcubacteria group bacterium GW2011_GWA2_44_12]|nr:MAG: hypothetical protein UW24_C0017G0009 [Parcubacteria group bacterium GW2011_GWA2_44_12]
MDSQFQNSNKLSVDNFRLISYCPLCSKHYDSKQVNVIDENEMYHLVHVVCEHCNSTILALVVTSSVGISSLGIVTDLTPHDVIRFKNSSHITVDDVLNIDTWLSDENFSFKIKISKGDAIKEKAGNF